jgi:hypothetical protein
MLQKLDHFPSLSRKADTQLGHVTQIFSVSGATERSGVYSQTTQSVSPNFEVTFCTSCTFEMDSSTFLCDILLNLQF